MLRCLLLGVFTLSGLVGFPGRAWAAPCPTAGPDLILINTTCQLSGVHAFGTVSLTNSTIEVNPYNGNGDTIATGNLELRAQTITIGASSRITARGAGHQTQLCGNGTGPTATGAGRGGCSVRDSGGGGAHFGNGGRGTIDNPGSFPAGYEEDCSQPPAVPASAGGNGVMVTYSGGVATCTLPGAGGARAPSNTTCRAGNDGAPTVAGQAYVHSIYEPVFGASGGDKGCLDGDGYNPAATGTATGLMVGGSGGGRIVLAGVSGGAGTVTIDGTLDANGKRGCGIGNDSGGGGAGGTVFVVGDNVTIGASARISAAGGLGGDTQGLMTDPTGRVRAAVPAEHRRPMTAVAAAAAASSRCCRGPRRRSTTRRCSTSTAPPAACARCVEARPAAGSASCRSRAATSASSATASTTTSTA